MEDNGQLSRGRTIYLEVGIGGKENPPGEWRENVEGNGTRIASVWNGLAESGTDEAVPEKQIGSAVELGRRGDFRVNRGWRRGPQNRFPNHQPIPIFWGKG